MLERPGLRRLDEAAETAGLVRREEGCEEPPAEVACKWPLSLFSTTLGSLMEFAEAAVAWTGVAVPEAGIVSSSRHFFTKLFAREASCLSLALRLSSLMCLPNRVA